MLTIAIYGAYLAVLGRLTFHIMGLLTPAFHVISLSMLSASFAWYFCRGRQSLSPVVAIATAMLVGIIFGYLSGLLSYVIVVCATQFDRFQHAYSARPLPLFVMWLGTVALMLSTWLPGGLAAIAICSALRFTRGGAPANR